MSAKYQVLSRFYNLVIDGLCLPIANIYEAIGHLLPLLERGMGVKDEAEFR